jgi:hypothetical protein
VAEFSLQALHDEIEADPEELGYKELDGTWKGDLDIYTWWLPLSTNGSVIAA